MYIHAAPSHTIIEQLMNKGLIHLRDKTLPSAPTVARTARNKNSCSMTLTTHFHAHKFISAAPVWFFDTRTEILNCLTTQKMKSDLIFKLIKI
jgi:hypothetical protein